jgi:hypothetical protein
LNSINSNSYRNGRNPGTVGENFDNDRNSVVLSAAARSLWPEDDDPRATLGRTLLVNGSQSNIVGVAGDAHSSMIAPAPPGDLRAVTG